MNTLESMRARQRTHARRRQWMAQLIASEDPDQPRPFGPRRVFTEDEIALAVDPVRSIQVAADLLGASFGTVARMRKRHREGTG